MTAEYKLVMPEDMTEDNLRSMGQEGYVFLGTYMAPVYSNTMNIRHEIQMCVFAKFTYEGDNL